MSKKGHRAFQESSKSEKLESNPRRSGNGTKRSGANPLKHGSPDESSSQAPKNISRHEHKTANGPEQKANQTTTSIDDDDDDDFLRVSPALQERLAEQKARLSQELLATKPRSGAPMYVDPQTARIYMAPRQADGPNQAVSSALKRHFKTGNDYNGADSLKHTHKKVQREKISTSDGIKDGLAETAKSSEPLSPPNSSEFSATGTRQTAPDLSSPPSPGVYRCRNLHRYVMTRKTRSQTRLECSFPSWTLRPNLLDTNVVKHLNRIVWQRQVRPDDKIPLQAMHWNDTTQVLAMSMFPIGDVTRTHATFGITTPVGTGPLGLHTSVVQVGDAFAVHAGRRCGPDLSSLSVRDNSNIFQPSESPSNRTMHSADAFQPMDLHIPLDIYFPSVAEDSQLLHDVDSELDMPNAQEAWSKSMSEHPRLHTSLLRPLPLPPSILGLTDTRIVAVEQCTYASNDTKALANAVVNWANTDPAGSRCEALWAAVSTMSLDSIQNQALPLGNRMSVCTRTGKLCLESTLAQEALHIIARDGGAGIPPSVNVLRESSFAAPAAARICLERHQSLFACSADPSLRKGLSSGRIIAGVNRGLVSINPDTCRIQTVIYGHRIPDTFCVALSERNPMLVLSGHRDGSMRLYDLRQQYKQATDANQADSRFIQRNSSILRREQTVSAMLHSLDSMHARFSLMEHDVRAFMRPIPLWFVSTIEADRSFIPHYRKKTSFNPQLSDKGGVLPFSTALCSISWLAWGAAEHSEFSEYQTICATTSGRAALIDLRSAKSASPDGSLAVACDEATSQNRNSLRTPIVLEYSTTNSKSDVPSSVGIGTVTGALCGEDQSVVSFGSEDGVVRLFHTTTGTLLNELILAETMYCQPLEDPKETNVDASASSTLFSHTLQRHLLHARIESSDIPRLNQSSQTNQRLMGRNEEKSNHLVSQIPGGILLDAAGEWKWGSNANIEAKPTTDETPYEDLSFGYVDSLNRTRWTMPRKPPLYGDSLGVVQQQIFNGLSGLQQNMETSRLEASQIVNSGLFSRASSQHEGPSTLIPPVKALAWSNTLNGLFVGRDYYPHTSSGGVAFIGFH